MKRLPKMFETGFLFAFLTAFAAGCATSPSARFYLLHSADTPEPGIQMGGASSEISIGIGPVKIPEYLDRPQIVTRSTASKLELSEFDRWAEPLGDNFSRVLAQNLSAMLATDRVVMYPWPKTTRVDLQVAVDVIQFEGVPEGKAILSARWTIYGEQGKKVIAQRHSEIVERVAGASPEDLVGALSRVLASLSREITSLIHERK